MSSKYETLKSSPNVKLVRDAHGNEWLCEAGIDGSDNLSQQGCVRADEMIYDRMFGG